MILRDVQLSELEEVLEIGCAHEDNRSVQGGLNTAYFIPKFRQMVVDGLAHIFGLFIGDKVVGALGFVVLQDTFNTDLIGLQNFWFVLPEHRGRAAILLLKEYERQARMLGCRRIQMPHQVKRQPENFGKFLSRFDFEPVEVSYYKPLEDKT